jgi:hypothetical protein
MWEMALGGDVIETTRADEARSPGESPDAKAPESARVPKRDLGRRAFSPTTLRTVAAVSEALLADERGEGLVAPQAELVGRIADEFDLWIGAGSPDLRRGYRALIWLIEWLPLFILGVFARASRLSLARRLAYLERLERAPFALFAPLVAAFKVPVTMLGYELDPELRLTGFDRTTVSTPRTLLRQLKVHRG